RPDLPQGAGGGLEHPVRPSPRRWAAVGTFGGLPRMCLMSKGAIRIGISGWSYAGWRGAFYPQGLAHRRELTYAAEHFGAIEINGTHYSLQRPESFGRWRDETPGDFV